MIGHRFHILPFAAFIYIFCLKVKATSAFHQHQIKLAQVVKLQQSNKSRSSSKLFSQKNENVDRRQAFSTASSLITTAILSTSTTAINPPSARAAQPNGLQLTTSATGLKWTDAKIGSGSPFSDGQYASIDYSIASTAGRFPQIYTTKDKGAPYRFKLGDGSTIRGIELSILGTDDIPPMLPGGIRRVIVPSSLGYEKLMTNPKCIAGEEGSVGPIPPKDEDLGAYQRWYSFYCNPRIPYQPDLVLDIKLYGKR